jgi:transposase InsO family protein
MSHDDSGHFGFDKSYDLVSSQYWFKGMRLFVRKYVDNCLNCHPLYKTPVPFHTVHIDHLGPFVKTKTINTQLFLIKDAFTKFILLYPVKSTKSKLAIKCLQDMIKVFGVPRRIVCDRGRSFTSEEFQEFCGSIQTKIHFNAVATPRGNGQVERYNRTVLDSLATMGADLDDNCWDENIHNVQLD